MPGSSFSTCSERRLGGVEPTMLRRRACAPRPRRRRAYGPAGPCAARQNATPRNASTSAMRAGALRRGRNGWVTATIRRPTESRAPTCRASTRVRLGARPWSTPRAGGGSARAASFSAMSRPARTMRTANGRETTPVPMMTSADAAGRRKLEPARQEGFEGREVDGGGDDDAGECGGIEQEHGQPASAPGTRPRRRAAAAAIPARSRRATRRSAAAAAAGHRR